MNILAIIPARGGSKRIPRKNIKEFFGKPIIWYSIKAALDSDCFDEIMVSTEDPEIAEISKSLGAEVPFLRSAHAATDHAASEDVYEEVLNEYRKRGKEFDYFCCIYATAPLISAVRIKEGFALLRKSGNDVLMPVVRFGYPIQRALKIENGFLRFLWPENEDKRSQDLVPAYHDCGQFYWIRTKAFLEKKSFFIEKTIHIELPELEVQDIDTEEDWKIAEMKYRILREG